MMRFRAFVLTAFVLFSSRLLATTAAVRDVPFLQEVSVRFTLSAELEGAAFRKLVIHRDGIVYVLTDRGVARLFDNRLALDHSFRPLAGLRPRDLALRSGEAIYLYVAEATTRICYLIPAWLSKPHAEETR